MKYTILMAAALVMLGTGGFASDASAYNWNAIKQAANAQKKLHQTTTSNTVSDNICLKESEVCLEEEPDRCPDGIIKRDIFTGYDVCCGGPNGESNLVCDVTFIPVKGLPGRGLILPNGFDTNTFRK